MIEIEKEPSIERVAREPLNIDRVLEEVSSFDNKRAKMSYIALSYYENKFSNTETMVSLLENDFDLKGKIESVYRGKGPDLSEEELEEILGKRVKHFLDIYNNEGLLSFIKALQGKQFKRQKEKAGIIEFYLTEREGGSTSCSIHFEKDDSEPENRSAFSIQESFEILADRIVESKTLPTDISAESWLMGVESLRERVGFQVEEEFDFSELDLSPAVWGQFIDESGDVKKKELLFLHEKGHPRYKKTRATIDIDSFFKKYGSKYKGEELIFVDTQEADRLRTETSSVWLEVRDKVVPNFQSMTAQEILSEFQRPFHMKGPFSTPLGKKVVKALEDAKSLNLSYDEFISKNQLLLDSFSAFGEKILDEHLEGLKEEFVYKF